MPSNVLISYYSGKSFKSRRLCRVSWASLIHTLRVCYLLTSVTCCLVSCTSTLSFLLRCKNALPPLLRMTESSSRHHFGYLPWIQPVKHTHRCEHLMVHLTVLNKQNSSRHDDFMGCGLCQNTEIYVIWQSEQLYAVISCRFIQILSLMNASRLLFPSSNPDFFFNPF